MNIKQRIAIVSIAAVSITYVFAAIKTVFIHEDIAVAIFLGFPLFLLLVWILCGSKPFDDIQKLFDEVMK